MSIRRLSGLWFALLLAAGCGSVSTTGISPDGGADKPKPTDAAGTSGAAGTTGAAGTSGDAGASGAAGTAGDAGTMGTAGTGIVVVTTDGGTSDAPVEAPPPKMYTLMVAPAGTGGGSITSVPAGVTCGATCMASYTDGTMVTLTAMPDGQSLFTSWGGACSGSGTCVVEMDQARNVTAAFTKATFNVTVDFQGSGSGSVAISPGGVVLNADGFAAIANGAAVTLTATPGVATGFGGWGGACSGLAACSFTLTADTNVVVKLDPPNQVFVTSTTQAPGQPGGLQVADTLCAARASAAGLTGTFRAFLGSGTNTTAWSRLGGARGFMRPDGKPIGDQVSDLKAGRTYYPLILTELGAPLPAGQTLVVTGVTGGATPTCSDWSSVGGGLDDATWGDPRSGYLTFVQNGGTACNNVGTRLYCFETARNVVYKPRPIPANGRRAFLSAGVVAGTAGLAAFDTQCANEAAGANLPGTYKAMLAGNGTAAAARFADGGEWYRTDGVALSATAAALAAGNTELFAALSLRADGLTQEQALVWTGAATVSAAGTATGTCGGWTTAGTAATMTYGNRMGTDWFGLFTTGNCGESHRVFCFQQ